MCEGAQRFSFQARVFGRRVRVFNSVCENTKPDLRDGSNARVHHHRPNETKCHDQESRNKIPDLRDGEDHDVNQRIKAAASSKSLELRSFTHVTNPSMIQREKPKPIVPITACISCVAYSRKVIGAGINLAAIRIILNATTPDSPSLDSIVWRND